MMQEILHSEYEFLQARVGEMEEAKKEIAFLWKEANLQGSETFGHDNPILETKREKSILLSLQQSKFKEVADQLASCLVVTEEEILKRKKESLEKNGKLSLDVGSIVTIEIIGTNKISDLLVAGMTQGIKMSFQWKTYPTICSASPMRMWIVWKSIGDIGQFTHDGKKKSVKIINIQ